jgi:hypothetical protein
MGAPRGRLFILESGLTRPPAEPRSALPYDGGSVSLPAEACSRLRNW